jgi:uncharacterized radical SAM superfamily protein
MTTCRHSFPDPHPAPLTHIRDCRHCGTSYQEAKAAMTAADEIEAAAKELQADQAGRETVLPSGAIISATLAQPLADWLETTATSLNASTHPDWQDCVAADALAVARAILGTQETT